MRRVGGRRREEEGRERSLGDMTPMIDVTFQLIIFFMLQKFRTLEGKLSAFLPKDMGGRCVVSRPVPKLDVHVYLVREGTARREGGRKVWTGRRLEWRVASLRAGTFRDLERILSKALPAAGDPKRPGHPLPVTIHPHRGVKYAEVTRTVDAVLQAGFERVLFSGSPPR